MDGLFGFFSMFADCAERAVARHEGDGLLVDTCSVTDSEHDYETAVSHPAYNDDKWVIVEVYNTEEEARMGHDKWVSVMTATKLPDRLFDVSTATIARLCDLFGDDWRQGYERQDHQALPRMGQEEP